MGFSTHEAASTHYALMMTPPDTPPPQSSPQAPPLSLPLPPLDNAEAPPPTDGVRYLEFKARILMLFMLVIVIGSVVYVMYARGAFEATQRLVLMADDSEGVVVGMDLTFSGFPIGRVQRIELADDGKARILIDVSQKDAHWLRTSSVFTLVRGIVGGTTIRAYTGILTDPELPKGAVRSVLQGDASAEIPKVVTAARELIDNLKNLTDSNSSMAGSLEQFKALTTRLNGPSGALGVLLGDDVAEAKKIYQTLERTNTLLARLDQIAARADAQVFGQKAQNGRPAEKGLLPETKAVVEQLGTLLTETRTRLQKIDGVLANAQTISDNARDISSNAKDISANAKDASADLGALRADVEASLRKVEALLTEVNRKWPFARDAKITLP